MTVSARCNATSAAAVTRKTNKSTTMGRSSAVIQRRRESVRARAGDLEPDNISAVRRERRRHGCV